MKKQILVIILLVILVASCLALTACHTHEFGEWTVVVQPTCTQNGSKERVCSCGEKQTNTIRPAHLQNGYSWHIDVEPTCTQAGSKSQICNDCGEIIATESIDPTGHDFNKYAEEIIPVTCTQDGLEIAICDCGATETRTIPASGHSLTAEVTQPTCTSQGFTTYLCYCGYSYIEDYVDALGHDIINHDGQEPTCTQIGWNAYDTCSRCDFNTYSEIPVAEHVPGDWIVDIQPTCIDDGSKHQICASCGTTINTDSIDAGHLYESIITSPTCFEQGYTTHTCTRLHCGYNYVDSYVDATGHSFENGICTTCDDWNDWGLELTLNDDGYSVTGIGACQQTNIIIPLRYRSKPVTSLELWAFKDCKNIVSITIPSSVTSIVSGAFSPFEGCTNLIAINVDSNNPNYKSIDGNLYSKDGKDLIEYAIGKTEQSFVVPNHVTTICDWAFSSATLTSVTFESDSQLSIIGDEAFSACRNLNSFPMLDNLVSIGSGAFFGCDFTEITFGKDSKLTSIGDGAFRSCINLSNVQLPDSLVSLGGYVFEGCALSTITIPKNVSSLGYSTFRCLDNMVEYIVDENNEHFKSVDGNLYSKDGKTLISYAIGKTASTFEIPYGVEHIGDYAFSYCDSLVAVHISDSVKTIGVYAFSSMSNLIGLTVWENVTSIGDYAFRWCTSLDTLFSIQGSPEIGIDILVGTPFYNKMYTQENVLLYSGSCLIGANLTGDSLVVTLPDKTKSIAGNVFKDCTNIVSITIPASVTSIGERAFVGCTNLKKVIFEEGSQLTKLGADVFMDCTSLESINIPNGVTIIGDNAFYNCSNLKTVTIPNSVTTIGEFAFRGCTNLEEIVVPNSVTSIGEFAFVDCINLKSVKFEEGIQLSKISRYLFMYCKNLVSIVIPNSVTIIEEGAFYAAYLSRIVIPHSVVLIGDDVFCKGGDYEGLQYIYYTGTKEQWNSISIGRWNTSLDTATIIHNYTCE